MRRKSSRNTKNSSPEKPKETPRKSRRSSRRRKRSTSRSSEESDDVQTDSKDLMVLAQNTTSSVDVKPDNESKNSEKGVEYVVSDFKSEDASVKAPETSLTIGQDSAIINKEDNKDSQDWKEESEDMEEKKNKGKSKGKNNSNFEQSSNNVEPETENENVQGTHQSPSNDYADNENVVQNINDSAKINTEVQEESKCEGIKVIESQDQQENVSEASFVSEYVQVNDPSEGIKSTEQEKNCEKQSNMDASIIIHKTSDEERSTTPEPKVVEDNSKNVLESTSDPSQGLPVEESSKLESGENTGSKKKITLRRAVPENKETDKVECSESSVLKLEGSSSVDEKKKEEAKPGKKITLKRHTTDDNNSSEQESKTNNFSRSLSEEVVERNRRLSSGADDKEQSREDKPKKVQKPIKLIRNLSRDNVDDEEKTKRITQRRQRWGRSDWLNKLNSSFYKIDVDSIKIVCPTLEFLGENEVNLESTPRERKQSESDYPKRKASIDNKFEDSDRPEYEKQISEESTGDQNPETNSNIIAMNRKISIVDDTASKLRPPPSPAKNPTSDVLFITNLVRPFTVKQLKELLERTGKIKEDGFWTDRIKSKCYVQYESVEEAEATRNALHGVHWPIGNGKKLDIDYAAVEDLEKAKNPAPVPAVLPEKIPEKENREPEREDPKFKERDDRRKRDGAPVREWDLGKEEPHKRFSRSRSRERVRKHSRRSYTPEGYLSNKKRKMEDAVPQKLMDDLFLKTKATPSIYWQPLSPEEIATKQQQRLVRMEEHKRRIEEKRGRVRDGRRAPFRRR